MKTPTHGVDTYLPQYRTPPHCVPRQMRAPSHIINLHSTPSRNRPPHSPPPPHHVTHHVTCTHHQMRLQQPQGRSARPLISPPLLRTAPPCDAASPITHSLHIPPPCPTTPTPPSSELGGVSPIHAADMTGTCRSAMPAPPQAPAHAHLGPDSLFELIKE